MPDLTDNHARLKPLEAQARELAPGFTYFQETHTLNDGRFSNLYWVEMDKGRFNFKLSSSIRSIPLSEFNLPNRKVVAGINFGSFFLSDDFHSPVASFYNLLVSEGEIFQFPSNSRPALKTSNGELKILSMPAQGKLSLGKKTFLWSGSHYEGKSDLTVFGMFDLTIGKIQKDSLSTRRKIIEETRFVTCKTGHILLGFNLFDGRIVLEKISNQPLDLSQFVFVMRGEVLKLVGIKEGQKITNVSCGDAKFNLTDDLCSASFCLGKTNDELIENLKTQLIYPKDSQPKPISSDYKKSWSVVLETKGKIIFFISDARPKVKNEEGLTVFELQELLTRKFNYIWACVGDSGQSSKLMVNGDTTEIYGNMHYQNYSGVSPIWDGKNGRYIPVALLAYE